MKLAKLRIGLTKITHQHLIKNKPPQYCENFIVPPTVKHLLTECPSLKDIELQLYPQAENEDGDAIMKKTGRRL